MQSWTNKTKRRVVNDEAVRDMQAQMEGKRKERINKTEERTRVDGAHLVISAVVEPRRGERWWKARSEKACK